MRCINPSQCHRSVPDQRGFFYGWRRERTWFGPLVQKNSSLSFRRSKATEKSPAGSGDLSQCSGHPAIRSSDSLKLSIHAPIGFVVRDDSDAVIFHERSDAPCKCLYPIYSQLQTLHVLSNEYIESFETEPVGNDTTGSNVESE